MATLIEPTLGHSPGQMAHEGRFAAAGVAEQDQASMLDESFRREEAATQRYCYFLPLLIGADRIVDSATYERNRWQRPVGVIVRPQKLMRILDFGGGDTTQPIGIEVYIKLVHASSRHNDFIGRRQHHIYMWQRQTLP